MTTEQVRTEINQLLQQLPKDNLISVLEYLQELQKLSGNKANLAKDLNKMLREDRDLLTRLAQ